MSLPILNVAKQRVTVPFLNKTYTIRPYLVGEEKALYMALESKDEKILIEAVKNMISACIEEKINIDDLSSFEIEFLFLQLRKISVNNVIEIGVRHRHNETCGHVHKLEISIDDIGYDGKTENKIVLDADNSIGVVMRPPTLKMATKSYSSETEQMFGIVLNSIEAIFDSSEVYKTSDIPEKELSDWLNQLNNNQFKMLIDYIQNLPTMYYDIKYTCEECGEVEEQRVEGITNFLF